MCGWFIAFAKSLGKCGHLQNAALESRVKIKRVYKCDDTTSTVDRFTIYIYSERVIWEPLHLSGTLAKIDIFYKHRKVLV